MVKLAELIHSGSSSRDSLTVHHTGTSKIPYVRVRAKDGKIYRVIKQNPDKDSKFAQMARNGAKICWILRENGIQLEYTGSGVINGQFIENMHG